MDITRIVLPLSLGTYSVGGTVKADFYTSSPTFNQSDVTSGWGYFYSSSGSNRVGGVITNIRYSRMQWYCDGLFFNFASSYSSSIMTSFTNATLTCVINDGTPKRTIFNPPAAE